MHMNIELRLIVVICILSLYACNSTYLKKDIYESEKNSQLNSIAKLENDNRFINDSLNSHAKAIQALSTPATKDKHTSTIYVKETEQSSTATRYPSEKDFRKSIDTVSTYSQQLTLQYDYFLNRANEVLTNPNADKGTRLSKLKQIGEIAFDISTYSFNAKTIPAFLGELVLIDTYDENILSIGLGAGISILNISGPEIGLLYAKKTKYFFKNPTIGDYFTVVTSKLYWLGEEISDNLPIVITAYNDGKQTTNSFDPIVPFNELHKYYETIVNRNGFTVYIVKPKENIYLITKMFFKENTDYVYLRICEINAIFPPNSNRIFPGQKLIIPNNIDELNKMYRAR